MGVTDRRPPARFAPPRGPIPATPGGSGFAGGGGGGGDSILTLEQIVAGASVFAQIDVGGVIPVEFGIINLAASQAAAQLYRATPASIIQANQVGLVVPFRGSLAAISFRASEAKTAGICTFRPHVDGVASSLSVDWTTGTTKGYKVIVQSSAIFDAGAEIDVRVTTDGSFAPITVDVQVTLFIALNPTTVL